MIRLVAVAALAMVVTLSSQEADEIARLLKQAEELAAAPTLSSDAREELHSAATTLRAKSTPDAVDRCQKAVDRAIAELKARGALGLTYRGNYSQTPRPEPVYGGHSSAVTGPTSPSTGALPHRASPVRFEEPTTLAVKTFGGGATKDHLLESTGNGVALFDSDNDGLLDIYFVTGFELDAQRQPLPHRNVLLRNRGGWKFEDVSAAAGVDAATWGNGACVGDADNDGDLDLYVTNFGPNFLFKNDGRGHFTDVARASGVQASGWSTGCTFFDADRDDDLDLYVARYVQTSWDDLRRARRTLTWRGGPAIMVGPRGLPGEADLFFENRGHGAFSEAAADHGLADRAPSYGLGVVSTDYDGDGWIDLFVANDSNPNFLYRNAGRGRFESVGLISGVALNADGRAQAGMGVDSGDYDGDGRLDFVLTTFAHDRDTIYRNVDGSQFEDVAAPSGLSDPTFVPMGWGAGFLDADLDGDLDLFVANGHIYPDVEAFPALNESFRQRNQLLLNEVGQFHDVSASAGGALQIEKSSRGAAFGDLDNDGDIDIVVSNMDDTPTLLENRQATGNHWIAIRLLRPGPNRDLIGARVIVDAGGRRLQREVRSGGSYLSQNDLRAHFGLGSHAGAVDVEVRVSGRAWRFPALRADELHVLRVSERP